MPEKTITGWLVVDWKSGDHRTRKKKPSQSELKSNELLAAMLEALEDDELPDWTDAVHEVVTEREDEIKAAEREDVQNLVHALTTRALVEVNTRPDPANVRDYVWDVVEGMREEYVEVEA